MIEFNNPSAFLFLLLIPVMMFLRYMKIFSKLAFPMILVDWNSVPLKRENTFRIFFSGAAKICLTLFYVFLVMAFASPVKHTQTKVYNSKGSSIIFVLDVSPSMAASDMENRTRFDVAKQAISTILMKNESDDFGLVEMAETSIVSVPPTMDRKTFLAKLNSISIGELGDGTAIGTGLSCAVFHLEKSSSVRKSIVLITDGENNAGSINPVTAARFAREKGISVYVLGVGTKGVVHLEYTDPKTQKVYSGYLESNFDNAALSRISLEANGKYFEADTISALSQAVSSINKTESAVVSYHMKNNDIEYYRIFLYFAAAFVTLAWIFRRFVLQEVL